MLGISPGTPPEIEAAFLGSLMDCPDCRAAILEANRGDDRKNVDIDDVMRDLAARGDH